MRIKDVKAVHNDQQSMVGQKDENGEMTCDEGKDCWLSKNNNRGVSSTAMSLKIDQGKYKCSELHIHDLC